jgi:aspartate aminotransferase
MTIANKINAFIEKSSWIRNYFEEGARLKVQHGAEKVFDFSLGNPDLPPPESFNTTLQEVVVTCGPDGHCYMPQAGYPQVCKSVAEYLTEEQGVAVSEGDILMTCGAAGALNVILKTLIDPGDEVIVSTPCLMEYYFYVDNHGGHLKMVSAQADFDLDLAALEAAMGEKTKAVLINSPNNPTGQIYSAERLEALGDLLRRKSTELGRTIYLLSDEPYRKIVFGEIAVPSVFAAYQDSIVATSYSRDLSIPNERIGFAAVNPMATHRRDLLAGLALANRILGFINAPALMQRVVSCLQGQCVDIGAYRHKRDLLCEGLRDAGYEFQMPAGAFYLFPKSPITDDVEFVRALYEELILVVPGSGFSGTGHFRIAFCVEDRVITNALPGFKRALERYK